MKKLSILFLLAVFVFTSAQAQTVDTIEVFSPKMDRSIKNVVILPAGYDKDNEVKYPVLYLLHGYSGRYNSWIDLKKTLPQEATRLNMIVVCPDGQNSWYWDSPVDPKFQFETYVSKELVEYIDRNYNTVTSPKGRAVTGLSMGGHGGLWLGINHPDVFGACGSMSGGVDIRPFPNSWEMKSRLGTYKANPERWNGHTVITQLDKIEPGALAIIFDCGTDDFFFQVNEQLHKEMMYRNIQHDYIVRPGGHTGEYWSNSIDYQMLFFSKFFNQK
ncbi:esterase family protein [Dysgonomonas sp. 521]|uniref:alpha/beta hydrolase n=1 Tax=Dysgonomonas sp. 521 TaxID=2302932 RepID=UPI0013D54755|nr:alpha/beta hydrolase-fold protein [Dysgonomonas sp. 521]NDV95080.1 esterase family protein [Dysgonomonas sp. 521]